VDTIESLQTFVGENLSLLAPVDQAWQPTDSYAEIIQHLNDSWGISHLSLSGKPARAQDYPCRQPERYERLAGEIADRLAGRPVPHFSWIHGRSA
jgi:Fatty acid desaturase